MILGLIPARGGSKTIPRKNMYPLNRKPLIQYTIDAAKISLLNNILISTDDKDIMRLHPSIVRPPELAQDDTPMLPVIQHAVMAYEGMSLSHYRKVDAVMVLQPTSPLRTTEDIDRAIELFLNSNASSLYGGYYIGVKHKEKPYDKNLQEPHFQRNGAIFIAKRELIEQGKLWDEDVIEFEMPKSRSIDIDDMDDLFIAEAILQRRDADCK